MLLTTLLLAAPAVAAQPQESAAGDAFAGLHERLMRVVEAQVEAIHQTPGRGAATAPAFSPETDRDTEPHRLFPGSRAVNPADSLERLNVALIQMQMLGVDAARIFVEEGVPLELLLVAEMESGYDLLARSPKGARGLWQLMPATATRFGLRVDNRVDERIHPQRATRAAARYLRVLYAQFGDWPLALAAYNAGEGRVADAIGRAGTRDFWRLVELRLLPAETRRYVPAVFANRGARW